MVFVLAAILFFNFYSPTHSLIEYITCPLYFPLDWIILHTNKMLKFQFNITTSKKVSFFPKPIEKYYKPSTLQEKLK